MKVLLVTLFVFSIALIPVISAHAETFLTVEEAKQEIWQGAVLTPFNVTLTKEQMKSIKSSSKTRVRHKDIIAWRTSDGDWFILDQIIGKHENIDIAVGLTKDGKVKDIEILTYRETYGGQIRNPKWLAQFFGKDHTEILKLDKQIRNISGATLSCRHVTDGINRLTHTWDQVLRNL